MKKRSLLKPFLRVIVGMLPIAGIAGGSYYTYLKVQSQKTQHYDNSTPTLTNVSMSLPKDTYRVMSFNVMNYGGDSSIYNSPKVLNIATTILKSHATLAGLLEINYNQGKDVNNIVKMLNKLNPEGNWTYVVQNINDLVDANHPLKTSTLEQVAIVYSQNVYDFINDATYQNLSGFPNLVAKDGKIIEDNKTFYPRKPYAGLFKNKILNKYLITAFAHFDSPGEGSYEKEHHGSLITGIYENKYHINGAGNQEISEDANIDIVYLYFYNHFKKYNPSFIMGVDTNTKADSAEIFDSLKLVSNYYPSSKANDKKYLTSLVTDKTYQKTHYGYANSYDHFFFKENNLNILDSYEDPNNPYKFDTVNGFKDGYYNKIETLKLWRQVYSKKQNDPKYKNPSDFNLIRIGLSDHAPIMIDYK